MGSISPGFYNARSLRYGHIASLSRSSGQQQVGEPLGVDTFVPKKEPKEINIHRSGYYFDLMTKIEKSGGDHVTLWAPVPARGGQFYAAATLFTQHDPHHLELCIYQFGGKKWRNYAQNTYIMQAKYLFEEKGKVTCLEESHGWKFHSDEIETILHTILERGEKGWGEGVLRAAGRLS